MDRPTPEVPDLNERSRPAKGDPQESTRRLFVQLQVFTGCGDVAPLAKALGSSNLQGALYLDVNDPRGVGLAVIAEDPGVFPGKLRDLLNAPPFSSLVHKPEMTMMGRTYATGREPNLEFALLQKPLVTALNPDWPWAVWYPLRRKSEFNLLPPAEQGKILQEHAMIGMSYGRADFVHDIRLACFGLDRDDNDFVIGLVGAELHPLSHIVQAMRKTVQTGNYIQSLGPFFVGKVAWQSPKPEGNASY